MVTVDKCPFCGSKAALDHEVGDERYNQSWRVVCISDECGAVGKKFSGSNSWQPDAPAVRARDKKAKADAIDWWNRRP